MKVNANSYVWAVVSFVNLAAFITGLNTGYDLYSWAFNLAAIATTAPCLRGFNGILEMDGFKDTFSELYTYSSNQSSSGNETRGCSSGNGAGSDSLIVSSVEPEVLLV